MAWTSRSALLLEAGGQESSFEREMVATLHFVGQDQREECGVVELLGTCQGKPVRQRWQELAQLETANESGEVRFEAHLVTSTRGR